MPALRSLDETRAVLLQSGLALVATGNRKPELTDAADRRSINHTDAMRIWATQCQWLDELTTWILTRTWVQGHRTTRIEDVSQTNQLMMMASLILAAGDPTCAHLIADRIDELDGRTHAPEVTNTIVGQSIRQNALAAAHLRLEQQNQVSDELHHNQPIPATTPHQSGTNNYTATAHHRRRSTNLGSLRV